MTCMLECMVTGNDHMNISAFRTQFYQRSFSNLTGQSTLQADHSTLVARGYHHLPIPNELERAYKWESEYQPIPKFVPPNNWPFLHAPPEMLLLEEWW
ncbi:hypothetical protein V9T40_008839 [Parthenolecanium corni]|uniref:Uncharacterized protein n=1 Tax=Parthenolecanium corni TaxID=536013 RepID=A0AAN9Y699_9HEMI